MRVVFMGTPEFAVPSLRALAAAHEVVAVYARPDARSGRGSALRPCPVKLAAEELGIPVLQPGTLNEPGVLSGLASTRPDVICVAAYGLLLPQEALDAAPFGALNVHASLLPRWRGAAPIERAILAGDEETGVAVMRMEAGLDTGPYGEVRRVRVGDADVEELTRVLAELGAQALLSALDALADGTLRWTPQDDCQATYAPKITKADVALCPTLDASDAVRRVRASSPRAPARACVAGVPLTVLEARLRPASAVPPGTVEVTPEGVVLGMSATGEHPAAEREAFLIVRLKPDGKRSMTASEWLHGARVSTGDPWTSA